MRYEPVTKSVEVFGATEQRAMTILATGKVFYTFISGLYSRKIESICREIISNARDGHTKRGNTDRPFFVHAPTRWEPYFSVRDFGTSISHETVMNHCSEIGWSSKETSNTEMGTFGYGMKSPFAYTSQFSLICWLDGEQRTYSYHIDENGAPQIVLRDTRFSGEEQGVEIRFDVMYDDIKEFSNAITLAAYQHSPCFESNITVQSCTILRDEGTFFINAEMAQGPYVQIGCVFYKIDSSSIQKIMTDEIASVLQDNRMVIRTEIGQLAVVPSREALEYTKKTLESLANILTGVFKHISHQVETNTAGFTSIWQAAEYFRSLEPGLFSHVGCLSQTPWGQYASFRHFVFDRPAVSMIRRKSYQNRIAFDNIATFDRGDAIAVYVFDARIETPRRWRARLIHDMVTRGITCAVHIALPDPATSIVVAKNFCASKNLGRSERKAALQTVFKAAAQSRKRLLEQIETFGCPVVVYQDKLPETPKVPRSAASSEISVYRKSGSRWTFTHHAHAEEGENIVFPLSHMKFAPDFSQKALMAACAEVGMPISKIVGVSQTHYKRFIRENPEWTPVADFLAMLNAEELRKRLYALKAAAIESCPVSREIEKIIKIAKMVPEVPPLFEMAINAYEDGSARYAQKASEWAQMRKQTGWSKETCETLLSIMGEPEINIQSEPASLWNPTVTALERCKQTFPGIDSHQSDEYVALKVAGILAMRQTQAERFHTEAA